MNKVKLLLYSTKAKPYLYDRLVIKSEKRFSVSDNMLCDYFLNGKIVAECDCDKVEKWFWNGWCGSDAEIPRYERDALVDDQGHSWGVCSVDLKTRMIHFNTEWWYDWFDDYVEREMEPLIKAGLVEEI